MMNYLENGNIINSVNFPNCNMGICTQAGRVAVFHKNTANMITKFTAIIGDAGINIATMLNKSKGEYAYTLIDIENPISKEIAMSLESVEGVLRVRIIKQKIQQNKKNIMAFGRNSFLHLFDMMFFMYLTI